MTGNDAVYWQHALTIAGYNRAVPNYSYLGVLRRRSPMWARVVNSCMDELNAASAFAVNSRLSPLGPDNPDKYRRTRKAEPWYGERAPGAKGNRARRRVDRVRFGSNYRRPKRPNWTIDS